MSVTKQEDTSTETLSQLIARLNALHAEYGDVPVWTKDENQWFAPPLVYLDSENHVVIS